MTVTTNPPHAEVRSPWRAVALPSEHGGWGLTLEPVLLGLIVAPSWAGVAIGLAAFAAFLARTPAKLVAIDVRRDRWLDRSRLALEVASAELVLLAALVGVATWRAGWGWWVPVLAAVPLVAVELWFDVRSRGRRLVPELCGAVGVCAAAAAIAVAGGAGGTVAVGAWLVLAARSLGAIPFIRAQLARARRGVHDVRGSDLAQAVATLVAAAAVVVDRRLAAGAVAVVVLGALQAWWSRHDPPPAKVIGMRQMAIGLTLVAVTALGIGLG